MKKTLILTLVLTFLFSVSVSAVELDKATAEKFDVIEETLLEENTEEIISDETSELIEDTSASEEIREEKLFVTMAINSDTALSGSGQSTIAPPLLVMSKTYVDLHDMAPLIGYYISWISEGEGGYRVTAGENTVDYTRITRYDDLYTKTNKYFKKDGKTYVPLRELTDLMGQSITYQSGIITVGEEDAEASAFFGQVSTLPSDDYIYTTYPVPAVYHVNPNVTYTYENMMSDTDELQFTYPELIKKKSIGKSIEGRELLLIEFGRGPKKIFVCGAHHAREYIATTYIMNAIDKYAYSYRTGEKWGRFDTRAILDKVTFCIVPMVNPDGINLVQNGLSAVTKEYADWIPNMGIYDGKKYGYRSWKANIRGVDLNWNYDKDWDISKNKNPRGSTGFNGSEPGSEPETVAVSNYVDSYPFEGFLSFHTQGEIFYWADNPEAPTGIDKVIKSDTGFKPYKEVPTGIGGSFFDYVYRKYLKPTVTIELCPYIGSYPYPDTKFADVWTPAKNVMLLFADTIVK